MLKEGSECIYINATVKNLLRLFEDDAVMEELDLGDTWHPFSGFVDAGMLFKKDPTVKEFLRHEYDWRGLVVFSCRIGSLKIERMNKVNRNGLRTVYEFRVEGPFKKLLKLEHLLIEKDSYEPGVYDF